MRKANSEQLTKLLWAPMGYFKVQHAVLFLKETVWIEKAQKKHRNVDMKNYSTQSSF